MTSAGAARIPRSQCVSSSSSSLAAECHDEVHEEFGIPRERSIIGVVALGYEVPGPKSPSLKRGKRRTAEVVHWGQFGKHA